MATSLRLAGKLMVVSFLASLCFSSAINIEGLEQSFTPSINSISSPPAAAPQLSPQLQDYSFFSHTALLPAILSHLGYHELSTAAPSLSESSTSMAWTGPSTLFAPTDSSLRACDSCSVANILREHLIPGAFTINYLRKLPFGSKIETLSPGRCITVTSERSKNGNDTIASAKVFVDGVEVTRPDLFNNGLVIVHGLQGFMAPLSPFSCDLEKMTSLSFPFHHDREEANQVHPSIMRLLLRDAMLKLRNNGFSILALAMRVKYADLVGLNNMTVFAVDDLSIFTGSHSYISNVRFHIVPNRFLKLSDLEKLPVETTLPTLERGQSLMVTTAGGGLLAEPIRINYVRIKAPEVMRNLKIVVHHVFLPFPHIHPVASAYDQILGGEEGSNGADRLASDRTVNGVCDAVGGKGGCAEVPIPQFKPTVEIEDHHGL